MGHRLFQSLSFASRPQSPARERTEPRLLPPDPPLPFRRPAQPEPGSPSAARDNPRPAAITPIIAVSDRQPVASGKQERGSLRFVALAGCILFAVAGVGSAAFLLLANPDKELTGAASPANPSAPLQTGPLQRETLQTGLPQTEPLQGGQTTGAVSAGAAERHPAETAAVPSPPKAPPQPAVNDAALQSPSGLPLAGPTSGTKPQPTAATVSEKPPSRTRPSAGIGDRHAVAAPKGPADHPLVNKSAETRRAWRAHPAERRAHLQPARKTRTASGQPRPDHLSPPQPPPRPTRVTRTAAPQQAEQTAAFNELLAHLTGSPKAADRPAGQSLTPPPASAPDPFARGTTGGLLGQ